jgi:hypothetical protein
LLEDDVRHDDRSNSRIQRKPAIGNRAKPYLVIAFAVAHKVATRILQDRDKLPLQLCQVISPEGNLLIGNL